ncbi:MAG: preprotein translocase subunit SecA [Bacteroidetes bacterium]|nr:MAG: preprotein translocase subunit SecA [Bacteroidota bacterium]RLD85379.1 MAG: preprotein translocase subunit SecA [Bacteroidota bacterium]
MVLNDILNKIFGKKSDKDIREAWPTVELIKAEYDNIREISNDELRAKTIELKTKINDYINEEVKEIANLKATAESEETDVTDREEIYQQIDKKEQKILDKTEEVLKEILPVAFAVMKETATRFFNNETLEVTATDFDRNLASVKDSVIVKGDKAYYKNHWIAGGIDIQWDMIHYDVQLMGGIVLHEGKIAEMATGEGKTLVATLPVFLNALTGKGVHIVTVNDYLAKRDAEWMGPLYEFHGLSVECIDKYQPNSQERRDAYLADITFGTNNEFGFDYLRDNMAISPQDLVQRKHHYSIVDEVDSVLIDDARTPLIISGPVPKGDQQLFGELKGYVVKLNTAQRKLVTQLLIDAKKLIAEGNTKEGGILLLRAFKGLPKNNAIIKYLSETGMKALMHKTEDIYLAENAKRMPEITDDLYFVIEERTNSIDLTDKGIDLISTDVDDNMFFVLPDIGSEIAVLEKSDLTEDKILAKKDKLLSDYAIKSERVHTINQLLKAYAMFEKDVEYVLMDNKVKIVDEQTGRIMDGRRYSDGLHQAIEAKENVKVEAATQTFATVTLQNYFRMYHKLAGMTGTAETEAGELWDIYKLDVVVVPTNRPIVRDDRDDLVYKTKREKYNAVIEASADLVKNDQPVLVGTTSVEISELLSRMLKIRGIKHNVLNAKLHQREADIVAEAGKEKMVTIATNMAGRGTDIKLSDHVKEQGGLAILGTERHESRRVDRQLRGRSGRQGDPGESQFFVSLEDDLMRMFGSDRIAKLMDRMGLEDGEVIQHSMISKSIERAQKKVEENNFGIRKRLLEYDDVMNSQREVVYKQRRHALYGERLGVDIINMMYDVCDSLVANHHGISEFEDFSMDVIRVLSTESPVNESEFIKENPQDIVEKLYEAALKTFEKKTALIAEQAFPVIKEVYETQAHQYENILVPITDGVKIYQVMVNLKKAYETTAKEVVKAFEKTTILATIDESWKEHLREMDDLKQSVQNATYEQKDPLLIYKFESYELFKNMVDLNNKSIISSLLKAQIQFSDPSQVQQARAQRRLDMSKYKTQKNEADGYDESQGGKKQEKLQPVRVEKKVGRNEPCPCGSGKKYKNCHGKS